jgi:hypothetical protein
MTKKFYWTSLGIACLLKFSFLFSSTPQNYLDVYVAPTTNSVKFNLPFTNNASQRVDANYNISQINGIKAGLRGQVFAGCRWFFKGYADYGWITSGNFDLDDTYYSYKANVQGNLTDGSIAAGYNFYPTKCLQIGPTIGWSYEKIYVYTKNLKRNDLNYQNQNLKTQLGGPFLGFEGNYEFNCKWSVLFGYECHMAVNKINIADDFGTTKGHLRNLIGNLGHVAVNYLISSCWNVGLDLLGYSYTSTRTGTIKPGDINAPSFTNRRFNDVTINTLELRVFTGYQF